ncbi:hypothetical protein [Aeromonas caviae]|uniref:hypothetical protein n=1 Tax=Aeromonas caviae TaxID=648 RepID=UPI0029DC9367|nr:hypothetical protein [Aeromonas caviae]MDX7767052.1 hypothetical protein [Aeromonas caviae]
MEHLLEHLAALPISNWIRASAWAFPLINTGHIFGLALLFGTIAVVDLRLVGFARWIGAYQTAALLLPFSMGGFILAVATGLLMFLADPRQYWYNSYFPWKLAFIAAAGTNAGWLHLTCWRTVANWEDQPPVQARIAGIFSIILWSGAILCGRLMAYF